jgi:hypothetical protein
MGSAPKQKQHPSRKQIQKRVGFWLLFISAGIAAYGLGLYQGSLFRVNRMVASIAKPVLVDLKPSDPKPSGPLNNPSNTADLKLHSKSH